MNLICHYGNDKMDRDINGTCTKWDSLREFLDQSINEIGAKSNLDSYFRNYGYYRLFKEDDKAWFGLAIYESPDFFDNHGCFARGNPSVSHCGSYGGDTLFIVYEAYEELDDDLLSIDEANRIIDEIYIDGHDGGFIREVEMCINRCYEPFQNEIVHFVAYRLSEIFYIDTSYEQLKDIVRVEYD